MKDTSTDHNYQIGVCGGGFAGISAALAAARLGKKVILFEKQYILGGLGTAGLVTIYLPLCDGLGHQVSFGIAEELFRLSIRYGAEDLYPANWLEGKGTRTERDRRFEVQYNPQLFAIRKKEPFGAFTWKTRRAAPPIAWTVLWMPRETVILQTLSALLPRRLSKGTFLPPGTIQPIPKAITYTLWEPATSLMRSVRRGRLPPTWGAAFRDSQRRN